MHVAHLLLGCDLDAFELDLRKVTSEVIYILPRISTQHPGMHRNAPRLIRVIYQLGERSAIEIGSLHHVSPPVRQGE